MKKKWIVGVVGMMLLAVSAVAQNSYMAQPKGGSLFGGNKKETSSTSSYSTRTDNWGLGIRLGIAQNNPKTLKDGYDEAFDYGWTQKEITKNAGVFGLEVLYETELAEESNKVGFKVGWDMYGENELKLQDPIDNLKLTETTYAFPLTLYYKQDNGIEKLSWLAGVGMTIMRSKVEVKNNYDGENISKTKVFPHVTVGAEYRFTKVFALGLDARYNIAAKIKKDGDVLSDRSGFGAALTGRFYF